MDAIDKLKAIVDASTQTKVGDEIGCGQGLVSLWLARKVVPSGLYAAKLRRYGITSDDIVALQARSKIAQKSKRRTRRRAA